MQLRTGRTRRGLAGTGAVAALLLGVTACGGDVTGEEFNAEVSAEQPHAEAPAPAEPEAPAGAPATPAPGGAAGPSQQRAQLLPVPNSPDPNVSGQLTIANASAIELSASGLQPGGAYTAHVHVGTCAEQGGEHFRFDPAGGEMPPNEVHLELEAGADGSGSGTTSTDRPLPAEARSVVLHSTLGEVTVACAELGEPLAP